MLAVACRRITRSSRTRDEFEAGLAVACLVYGVSDKALEHFMPQIECGWHKELKYRMQRATQLFQRLHARHAAPAKTKTRPARPTFKRARTY